MNNRTANAFRALHEAIKGDPKLLRLYGDLQDATEHEIETYATKFRDDKVTSNLRMRDIIQRAWQADPVKTELDLIEAGRRGLASTMGAVALAEESRTRDFDFSLAKTG